LLFYFPLVLLFALVFLSFFILMTPVPKRKNTGLCAMTFAPKGAKSIATGRKVVLKDP